jgi:signal recognition particle receptor subunit beta
MLVFSLTDADTLYYCEGYVESAKRANAEMVLVGSKNDLPSTISDEQVNEFMEKHNIRKYYKTSANTKENVDNAFEYLIYRSLYKMHKHIQVWSGVTQVCDERKPARVQKKCLLM